MWLRKEKDAAEASGINLDVSNRWESLIDQAIKWKNKTGGLVRTTTEIRPMVRVNIM